MAKFELKDPLSWLGGKAEENKTDKTEIETEKIKIVYSQPRENIGGREFDELMNSIKTHGLLEPIVIKEDGSGNYNLICGERRLAAFRQLGLKTIKANIRNDIKEEDIFIIQIIENLQRKELEPIELAKAYKKLLDKNKTIRDIASLVGKSKSHISDMISLLSVEDDLQGKITKKNVRKAIEVSRIDEAKVKKEIIKDFDELHIKDIQNKKNSSLDNDNITYLINRFNEEHSSKMSVLFLKKMTSITLKIPSGLKTEKILKQIIKIKED
ncbi:MAG: ParB/RepB/Spo0J family partition protein [Deltaproteobacteria bacterium]|jgi:ParB family chromosome partitioning protein|nr:ParB/RepB/Spo0J family partition protein [Deltaproteobacteria bacterium]